MRFSEPAPNSKIVNKWAQNRRRELGLCGCAHSAGKRAAISDPKAGSRPDFASPVSTYEFVDDIAYLWTGEGVLCPFTVIGLNGRIVVGWSLSERMAVDIVASAESRGCVVVNAIFNADSKNVARRFCSNRNGAVSCSQDRIAAS